MKGYLLDTDTCIFFLRGKYGLKDKVDEVGIQNCYVSEVTIGELFFGAEYSQNIEQHISEVEGLENSFQVLPIYTILRAYAKEKARLRRAGTPIAEFDLLIGITAVQRELVMVTNNVRHFSKIEGIKIENWMEKKYNKFV